MSEKLKPEFKREWVEALRSGKYEQAMGLLRRGHRFCCLGVAADLRGNLERDGRGRWREKVSLFYVTVGPDFCREIGLSSTERLNLASMNDGGAPFAEIAAYIEANL